MYLIPNPYRYSEKDGYLIRLAKDEDVENY